MSHSRSNNLAFDVSEHRSIMQGLGMSKRGPFGQQTAAASQMYVPR